EEFPPGNCPGGGPDRVPAACPRGRRGRELRGGHPPREDSTLPPAGPAPPGPLLRGPRARLAPGREPSRRRAPGAPRPRAGARPPRSGGGGRPRGPPPPGGAWRATHKRMGALADQKKPPPVALRGHVIFYVGPPPAPPGKPIGSAGPT